jgi:FG-GAP-like repeat
MRRDLPGSGDAACCALAVCALIGVFVVSGPVDALGRQVPARAPEPIPVPAPAPGPSVPSPNPTVAPNLDPCVLQGRPRFASASPAANTIASPAVNIGAGFTSTMTSANAANFVVRGMQTGWRPGLFGGGGTNALSLDPTADFRAGEHIEVTLTKGLMSTGGKPLCAARVFRIRAATSNTGPANGTFAPPTNLFPNGFGYRSIVSGDFNADSKLDLAVANQDINKVTFLYGKGDGTFVCILGFGSCFYPSYTVGSQPNSIVADDFNNDGRLDLATTNGSTNDVSVLLNTGNADLGYALYNHTTFASSAAPSFITTGDLNADGKADIVTSSYGAKRIAVLLNDGSGTFGAPTLYVTGESPSLVLADFTNDGALDLVATDPDTDQFLVRRGKGDGTFLGSAGITAGSNVWGITSADINNDGKLDIVTTNHQVGPKNVSVLFGNGNLTFGPPTYLAVSGFDLSDTVVVADLNGDAQLDMAVVDRSNAIAVLINTGGGTFGAAATFATGSAQTDPFSLTVGDFNADGDLDLATANYPEYQSGVAGSVSVLTNQP